MAEIEIHTERVDDVPLLVHQQQRMGIAEVVDDVVHPQGNRQGLSVGGVITCWLSYILSEADHRMSVVESWSVQQRETLSALLPQPIREKDFADDRLADVLRLLSDDERWGEIEERLGQRLLRVYDLRDSPLRLDSTTAAVYHDTEGNTLFRRGYSKDHRPDLGQFKVMLAAMDPLGMPLATLVVAGSEVDDGLYVPAVIRARRVVGQGGRLYIGDTKMGSLATRSFLQESGDFYLMPLPRTGKVPELMHALLERVWKGEQRLQRVYRPSRDVSGNTRSKSKVLALGYEVPREQEAQVEGKRVLWQERVLVIYSPSLAKKARRGLAERLRRSEQELLALTPPPGRGKRRWDDLEALKTVVQAILKRRRVLGLLEVDYLEKVERRRLRRYQDRPPRTEERRRYVIEVRRKQEAISTARRLLGWRLYVSNGPMEVLSLSEAVWAYRGAPRIERDFGRLKGHPLGLRPLYVQREDHARGMVRLLSLGLRVLTVVEHVVRQELQAANATLAGLYPGNPKRQTARPTTERLLKAFQDITLTLVHLPNQTIRHVTPLSSLQHRILQLLSLPASIYENLALPACPIPP